MAAADSTASEVLCAKANTPTLGVGRTALAREWFCAPAPQCGALPLVVPHPVLHHRMTCQRGVDAPGGGLKGGNWSALQGAGGGTGAGLVGTETRGGACLAEPVCQETGFDQK